MPNQPNLYAPSWPLTHREYMNLVDRVNYLTTEVDKMRVGMPDPGARKENPQPGIITIPFFGGNGFIRVNEDGVISSYSSPAITDLDLSLLGVYFTDPVARQTTAVTTEETLSSKTMPPGMLANDGDFLFVMSCFSGGANANTKRFRIYFGTTVIYDTGAQVFNNVSHTVFGYIYRRTSTILSGAFGSLTTTLGVGSGMVRNDVGGIDFTISNVLKTTGQNGAAVAADIIQFGFIALKGSARS